MLLTPTYHVFEMFKGHQDATLLPAELRCDEYGYGDEAIPALSASASRGENGGVLVTLCNLDPQREQELVCEVRGGEVGGFSGRVLTAGEMTAHNTFDEPERFAPVEFTAAALQGDELSMRVPAVEVAVELR